jgi:hypothetical protein
MRSRCGEVGDQLAKVIVVGAFELILDHDGSTCFVFGQ